MNKKGKLIGVIAAIFVFAAAYYGVQHFSGNDFEVEMKKAAADLNRQLPKRMDRYSVLDSAATRNKSNFTYYYTLVALEKSQVFPDSVYKYMKPGLVENIKTNKDFKMYRDNDITIVYRYYDRNGDFAVEIAIPPNLYK